MHPLKDQAARDIIKNDMRSNLMVEAGAGSGKTEEMSKRILALVSGGYRNIDEIVAITFTRKAANELRERVRTMLKRAYEQTGDSLQKKALDHIHACFIGTIHAFCGKILRERPFEAGIDPQFEPIDEAKDHFTRQKVWEDYVLTAGEEENELLRLMEIFDVREAVAKNFLKIVCDNQDIQFDLPNEPIISYDSMLTMIKNVVTMLSAEVMGHYGDIPDDVINRLVDGDGLQKSIMRFHDQLRGSRIENLTDGELVRLLMIFATKSAVEIKNFCWSEKADIADKKKDKAATAKGKELKTIFPELYKSEIVPLINQINVFVYNVILIPFVVKAKALYMKHKHTVAELNFQDLLMKTSDMLRDFPEARGYFQNRYKTLLIDEFQDTDPIQVSITMYLVGEEREEKRWNKITPKEGSLFVVGDPKQSIYGFRRADFSMYKRFKEHMLETGGKIITLYTNFRAVNRLGEWYNQIFVDLLNSEEQAEFTEMEAVMPVIGDTLAGVTYYRIEEKKVDDVIEKEAENLTQIIRHFVTRKTITVRDGAEYISRPVQYKDIMVLTMKKKQLEVLGNEMAKRGIPVKITGADIVKQTAAFISFRNLVRMLAYPEENAYLHHVMRGDFFRISDKEIYDYHRFGGEYSLYFDFEAFFEKNALSNEIRNTFMKVKNCFIKLRRFLDYVKTLSSAAASERIIEELDIMKAHLATDEKIAGFGSFISLIEKIRLKKITDIWGLELFINEIAMMIENGFEENVDIEGKGFNAVRVMNTHKAKGLEAPIVMLCAPCSGKIPDPTFYTECVPDEDMRDHYFGYVRVNKNPDLGFMSKQYFEPSGWADIEEKAKQKEQRERERLLYVAATRAKNLLVIGDSAAGNNPWDKLLGGMPGDAANLLDEVYAEETEADIAEVHSADEAEIDKTLAEIKAKRDEAFNHNRATFGIYTPSEKAKHTTAAKSERLTHEQEKTIQENTMEVIINGEIVEVKAGRLDIGTIIHRLFEALVKNESALPDTIQAILQQERDDYITKAFLENAIAKFKERKLYDRIRKSDAVYTEVPFSYKVSAGNLYVGTTFDQDTYVNGVIDLVFKEDGKWIIVDYKTYADKEASHDLRKMYEPQLNAYKDVWEALTGECVSETEIFFVLKRLVS